LTPSIFSFIPNTSLTMPPSFKIESGHYQRCTYTLWPSFKT